MTRSIFLALPIRLGQKYSPGRGKLGLYSPSDSWQRMAGVAIVPALALSSRYAKPIWGFCCVCLFCRVNEYCCLNLWRYQNYLWVQVWVTLEHRHMVNKTSVAFTILQWGCLSSCSWLSWWNELPFDFKKDKIGEASVNRRQILPTPTLSLWISYSSSFLWMCWMMVGLILVDWLLSNKMQRLTKPKCSAPPPPGPCPLFFSKIQITRWPATGISPKGSPSRHLLSAMAVAGSS